MSAFLAAVLSFPTVVFTVVLGFFLLYALATLLGAADIEWLDGALGVDDVDDSALEGALSSLGVAGVPLAIFGGVASVVAWMTSFTLNRLLPGSMLIDLGILALSSLAGIGAGSFLVRPLRRVFATADGPRRDQIVGRICTIRSLRVSATEGTAEVGDFIADVRCGRENDLTIGSKAVVYDYDARHGIYHVAPLEASVADVDVALNANGPSTADELREKTWTS